jgi:hypothetical protein
MLVVLIPLGVVWVHDRVSALVEGISRGLGNLTVGLEQFITATYAEAAEQVLTDESLARELGEPVSVGSINDVTWLESTVPGELQFRFPVRGSRRAGVVEFRAYQPVDAAERVRIEMTSVEMLPGTLD